MYEWYEWYEWYERASLRREKEMVEIGDLAPDFTLTADDGTEVSLSDFRGRRVALYFYPKADTPGCTRQACAIRDVYPQIDSIKTHPP